MHASFLSLVSYFFLMSPRKNTWLAECVLWGIHPIWIPSGLAPVPHGPREEKNASLSAGEMGRIRQVVAPLSGERGLLRFTLRQGSQSL